MLGWFKAEADRASFSNRLSRSGSEATPGQHLDRHLAPEPRVPRAVDLSHASRSDRSQNLVRAQTESGRERHLRASGGF